jgi:hypothetical protein
MLRCGTINEILKQNSIPSKGNITVNSQEVSDTTERWQDYRHGVFGFGGNFAVDHIPHMPLFFKT